MIHHVTLEIEKRKTLEELDFWKALEFVRLQRTRVMGKTEWLKGPEGQFIHLYPREGVRLGGIPEFGHVALAPSNYHNTLVQLDHLPFTTRAEHGTMYWGAKRVFVFSPSGHRVELMEFAPAATWPGPPRED